jgi:hypothetical protein
MMNSDGDEIKSVDGDDGNTIELITFDFVHAS